MGVNKVRDLSHKPNDLLGKTVVLQVRDEFGTETVKSPAIKVSSQQAHLVARKEKKSFGSGTEIVNIF